MGQWSTSQGLKAIPQAQSPLPWMGFQPPLHIPILHLPGNQIALGLRTGGPGSRSGWPVASKGRARQPLSPELAAPLYLQWGLRGNLSPIPDPGTECVPRPFWHGSCNHSRAHGKCRLTQLPCPSQGPEFSFYAGPCKLGSQPE